MQLHTRHIYISAEYAKHVPRKANLWSLLLLPLGVVLCFALTDLIWHWTLADSYRMATNDIRLRVSHEALPMEFQSNRNESQK